MTSNESAPVLSTWLDGVIGHAAEASAMTITVNVHMLALLRDERAASAARERMARFGEWVLADDPTWAEETLAKLDADAALAPSRPEKTPEPPSSAFLEAVTALVDAVLDRPSADPDDDAAKAARRVLRTDPTASEAHRG